jgi:hypothetical protein
MDALKPPKDISDVVGLGGDPLDPTHLRFVSNETADRGGNGANDEGRPTILVTPQVDEVVAQALAALEQLPNVYQRAGALAQVVREPAPPSGIRRPPGAPRTVDVHEPRLRELLACAATWMKRTKKGDIVQVIPPTWAVQGLIARDEWPKIPLITCVVEVPAMRADGSVLCQPGYDATTGLFFEPPPGFTVELTDRPSRDEAIAAARVLLDLVAEFPFRSEIDRAAWLAALLTTFCRFALTGSAPLFLIDGNTRGCGKSLLADVTALIASGRSMTRMAPPETDEEMRKRITALALAGDPLAMIDNVAGEFGWPSLDAALTGDT